MTAARTVICNAHHPTDAVPILHTRAPVSVALSFSPGKSYDCVGAFHLRKSSGNFAIFAAMRRASSAGVNSDTSLSDSHTDNNSGCSIGTETPTPQYEHNQNCRNDKSPVSSGLVVMDRPPFLERCPSLRPSCCTRGLFTHRRRNLTSWNGGRCNLTTWNGAWC